MQIEFGAAGKQIIGGARAQDTRSPPPPHQPHTTTTLYDWKYCISYRAGARESDGQMVLSLLLYCVSSAPEIPIRGSGMC